jgi:hypothetical protein
MARTSIAAVAGALAIVAGVAVAGTAAQASGAPAVAPALPASAAVAPATGETELIELAALGADTTPGAKRADGARVDLLCARVPNAVQRTQNLQARLAGDASTQGSLAWLSAKAAAAEKANRDELATVLKNRLAFRTQLAQFLPHRLELLQKAASTVCASPSAS